MEPGYGPPAAGERWNVNMPAVIGVVVVFIVGVIVWVLVSSADGDGPGEAADPTVGTAATTTISTTDPTPAPTLSPTPLPTSTTTAGTTATTTTTTSTTPTGASTTTSSTAAPGTTVAPTTTDAEPPTDAVPGDLDIAGHPMERPPCDGAFITIVGSPVGEQATAEAVGAVLDQYPGTTYLRTDRSCPSLTQDVDGEPIYVIYFGPFAVASDACSARADGPEDAYARELSDELGPDHSVACA